MITSFFPLYFLLLLEVKMILLFLFAWLSTCTHLIQSQRFQQLSNSSLYNHQIFNQFQLLRSLFWSFLMCSHVDWKPLCLVNHCHTGLFFHQQIFFMLYVVCPISSLLLAYFLVLGAHVLGSFMGRNGLEVNIRGSFMSDNVFILLPNWLVLWTVMKF